MAFRSSLDLSRHSGPKRNIPVGGVSLAAGAASKNPVQDSLSSFGNFSDFNDRISGEIKRRQQNLAFNKFEGDENRKSEKETMKIAERFAADQAADQKRNSIFGLAAKLAPGAIDLVAPGAGTALAAISGASSIAGSV